MPKIKINNEEYDVPEGITLIQACDYVSIEIPRFCYHDRLSIAGNCRMCLVEMEGGPPKPIASCATAATEGMSIKTDSEMVRKARKGVSEFLLANHPLDCPICDQGGECDLQDQAYFYGSGESRYKEDKRAVKEKDFGPLVKTAMTRCIHCMRCVRFASEIAGVEELGSIGRGNGTEVMTYVGETVKSELSGNIIDLCPVGALTSKPYAFTARSWELIKTESIDVHDAVGSNIRVDSKGQKVMRIVPRLNESINEEWISDKTRFSYDGLVLQRLDKPYIKKNGKLVAVEWSVAIEYVAVQVNDALKGKKRVAALSGDLTDVESMFVMKQLLQDLGSRDYDCRPENSVMKCDTRSSYLFNTTIEAIEEADLFLFVGVNPRKEAAIINSKIGKRVREYSDVIAYNIGVDNQLTYQCEQLGNDVKILADILNGENVVAGKLKKAKKPLIIVGESCFRRKDSQMLMKLIDDIIQKYKIVSTQWNGFNILHNAAARVGGLDLKFVPENMGRNTADIIKDAESKKGDVVFLLGYDCESVYRMDKSFNIYIGSHGDRGADMADVILPGAAYTEKNATYVNTEGRVQSTSKAVSFVGEAREDWMIVNEIRRQLGFSNFRDDIEMKEELGKKYPVFSGQDGIYRDNKLSSYSGKGNLMVEEKFVENIKDFYMTNAISRASKIMSRCIQKNGK